MPPAEPARDGLTALLVITPDDLDRPGTLRGNLHAWCGEWKKLDRPLQWCVTLTHAPERLGELEAITREVLAKHSIDAAVHATPGGFGGAVRQALGVATQPLFFYTSLNYLYCPAELHELLQRLEEVDAGSGLSLHLVTGFRSRTPLTAAQALMGGLWRGLLGWVLNVPADAPPASLGRSSRRLARRMRWLFGVRVHDTNSHFKLFRRTIFDRIPIQSDGEFVHGEILAKANFLGCYMDELVIARGKSPLQAPSAIPGVPAEAYRDLRRVLQSPDFGPYPLETKAPADILPAGAVTEPGPHSGTARGDQ